MAPVKVAHACGVDTSQELVNERATAARSYNLLPIPSFLRSLKWVLDGALHLFCQKSSLILGHLFWDQNKLFQNTAQKLVGEGFEFEPFILPKVKLNLKPQWGIFEDCPKPCW